MFPCSSGKHYWLNPEDAAKCCNPAYVRVLKFGGGDNAQECGGVSIGREWISRTDYGSMAPPPRELFTLPYDQEEVSNADI